MFHIQMLKLLHTYTLKYMAIILFLILVLD